MSKTWKWILGITFGLVILVSVGLVVSNFFGYGHIYFWNRPTYYGHPMMEDYGFGKRLSMEGYRVFRHPMMGARGFYPPGRFLFLGGLLRLIFPLGVLALVAYFSYKAGKKDGLAEAHIASVLEAETATDTVETPKRKGRKTTVDN